MSASPTQTRSGPTPGLLESYLEKKSIRTLMNVLELYQFGREAIVPSNAGRAVYAPYFRDDTAAAGIIDESVALNLSGMSALTVSGNMSEYVKGFGFGRLLLATKAISLIEEGTAQLMNAVGRSWEDNILGAISNADALSAASWVAGDRVTAYNNVLNTTIMKASAFSKAAAILENKFNVGYTEFGGAFGAVVSPVHADHLRVNINTGTTSGMARNINFESQSMGRTGVYKNNVLGNLFNVRISVSQHSALSLTQGTNGMSTNAAQSTGRQAMVFAPESFFVAPLEAARPEIILHGLGSAGSSDPANRLASLTAYGVFDAFTNDTIRADRLVAIVAGTTDPSSGIG